MVSNKNLYSVLGVSIDASQQDIKSAYIQLAKQFHPDKNSNLSHLEKKSNLEKMYQINEAYSVLSDPQKRLKYDLILEISRKAKGSQHIHNRSLEEKLGDLIEGSETITDAVIAYKFVAEGFSSVISSSADLIKTFYRKFEEERKGKKIDRKA